MPTPKKTAKKLSVPKRPPAAGQKIAGAKEAVKEAADAGLDEYDLIQRSKNLSKPDDQLELTEKELTEEIARMLTTHHTQKPENLVEYSFKEQAFVVIPLPSDSITLLEVEGTCLHKESPEAIAQIELEGWPDNTSQVTPSAQQLSSKSGESDEKPDDDEEGGETEAETEAEPEAEAPTEGEGEMEGDAEDEEKADVESKKEATGGAQRGRPKKLTNQFNFCERAALTYNNPLRELSTQTVPPPRAKFSAYITQWIIYDAYQGDFESQQKEKEKERREKLAGQPRKEETMRRKHDKVTIEAVTIRMLQAAKILERMINQNTFDEIAQGDEYYNSKEYFTDYRYWEDPSDEYRDTEGTLLPLWKFSYEKTKRLTVTEIHWNPRYYDLFGVTFGSFDFTKQVSEGYLCLFTLKNPSFPEYINSTDSGIMCLEFHPNHAYLVVVGLYDGTVSVYNVQLATKDRQFTSNSVSNKHGGIVWQVCWGKDLQDGEMNFFSVSSDGKVYNWVLMQNELAQTLVVTLYLNMDPLPGPDGTLIRLTGCGTAIAFHPNDPLIFLVGTEEGYIYKCSTAYASLYLFTYTAHHMPVHRIDFNKYLPDIFISCSADWRVKIWEDNRSEPLFVFDLGCSVGDVKWAPYSSTVFAAITIDGKVHVFDLNINKYKAICTQAIVSRKRNKLTRLAFNYKLPIFVAGDDRGSITTLKLSPNLRIKPKLQKKQAYVDPHTLEIMKLDKLLSLVREPQKLEPPPDTESVAS